ncbi:MAG: RNA-binding protein, partial [Marivirga sp.]|nr:RNA-binding protein [Marivirga sp.]
MKLFLAISLASLFLAGCSQKRSDLSVGEPGADSLKLFKLLLAEETGVDFVNEIEDGEKFNILTYRNFYNGGGVAIGDINNDSLPDLYFTANQKKNKLYLNKGNFVFEDITEKAGVGGKMAWSTGVTMADVNNDGLLDIYVCNSGDVDGADRENELFINNGDLTFSEQAKTYNLNNKGYSTHASFFDYDLDGDLDCYILNNSFKDPGKIELYKKVREIPDEGGDKLMRNDDGIFHDVTTASGIYSSDIGFGLGVAVSDLNSDHLPDIYISNDFWERDYLYINKGNGKFSEELIDRINYCSISSMGADIADLNDDGKPEIFTTDMLPADNSRLKTTMAFDPYHLEDLKYRANFHYQMVQNCLHLNDGFGDFQEVALMSGVAATDWSWGALIFDFENDGNKDIFVSNGILKDIMSMDFREFIADREKRNEIIAKKGKYDDRDFISFIPSNPLSNYAFQNNGKLTFQDKAKELGLNQPSFSNGSAYGDLDNDGDLDLVINNVNSPSFVYKNETDKKRNNHYLKIKFSGSPKNLFGIGAQVTIKMKGNLKVLQNFNTRGFESSVEPGLLFGIGSNVTIDSLEVIWPDGKTQVLSQLNSNRTLVLNYTNAAHINKKKVKSQVIQFEEISKEVIQGSAIHRENLQNDFNDEILLTRMLSTEGPRLIAGDVNNDKLDDFILLGAAGDPDKLFIQSLEGKFTFKQSESFMRDKAFESTCGSLFDHDGDGDNDLMIGSGGNKTAG